MHICKGDVTIMSALALTNGRTRAIAREKMRLTMRTFHGYGLPKFGGKAIRPIRAYRDGFRKVRKLPIVSVTQWDGYGSNYRPWEYRPMVSTPLDLI